MGLLLYNTGIRLYAWAAWVYGFFNNKAKEWFHGTTRLSLLNFAAKAKTKRRIWFHISSLGEYEQAVPLLQELQKENEIVITFFSPSGYHVKKQNPFTEEVYFLPLDTRKNATKAFSLVNPDLFILVKYDYWYHYINEASKRAVPVVVVSASFRQNQVFFKPYGGLFRRMLEKITFWYTQNQTSEALLNQLGHHNHLMCGDTRIDSILNNKGSVKLPKAIHDFIGSANCLVMGSCYAEEESIIKEHMNRFKGWKIIFAPHQMSAEHIEHLGKQFDKSVLWSKIVNEGQGDADFLIVDEIGWLKHLYSIADLAFIGGGFGRTVHNTLEPAAYGIPIVFGPNYKKFNEAVEMVSSGGAFAISDANEFGMLLDELLNESFRKERGRRNLNFMALHKGGTGKVIAHLNQEFTG